MRTWISEGKASHALRDPVFERGGRQIILYVAPFLREGMASHTLRSPLLKEGPRLPRVSGQEGP